MSYDLYLVDPVTRHVIEFEEPIGIHGGTYQLGGTTTAWLNITYNYSPYFYSFMGEGGIRRLYGMSGRDSITLLDAAIDRMTGEPDSDYWAATEGNAKAALLNARRLAELCPAGIWEGD